MNSEHVKPVAVPVDEGVKTMLGLLELKVKRLTDLAVEQRRILTDMKESVSEPNDVIAGDITKKALQDSPRELEPASDAPSSGAGARLLAAIMRQPAPAQCSEDVVPDRSQKESEEQTTTTMDTATVRQLFEMLSRNSNVTAELESHSNQLSHLMRTLRRALKKQHALLVEAGNFSYLRYVVEETIETGVLPRCPPTLFELSPLDTATPPTPPAGWIKVKETREEQQWRPLNLTALLAPSDIKQYAEREATPPAPPARWRNVKETREEWRPLNLTALLAPPDTKQFAEREATPPAPPARSHNVKETPERKNQQWLSLPNTAHKTETRATLPPLPEPVERPTSAQRQGLSLMNRRLKAAAIEKLIKNGDVDAAFTAALSAMDLRLVLAACRACDPMDVFSPCRLQQNTLLSLVQQLSTDLVHDTELKCDFIEYALTNLDRLHPATFPHHLVFVEATVGNLSIFLTDFPYHAASARIRIIMNATTSLVN